MCPDVDGRACLPPALREPFRDDGNETASICGARYITCSRVRIQGWRPCRDAGAGAARLEQCQRVRGHGRTSRCRDGRVNCRRAGGSRARALCDRTLYVQTNVWGPSASRRAGPVRAEWRNDAMSSDRRPTECSTDSWAHCDNWRSCSVSSILNSMGWGYHEKMILPQPLHILRCRVLHIVRDEHHVA